jgi:hypothetical protein
MARRLRASRAQRVAAAPADETETCKNFRLRQERRDDWRRADALRECWHASWKMNGAISRVQSHDMPEGAHHPQYEPGQHWTLVAKYRDAIMAQLLTPAPTAREVEWKRAVFKGGDHEYTDVKPERIERAIADDVEFLRTHPTRRSGKQGMDPKKLEERRAWKAAFRARVTTFAEKNSIPKSELAWLGRLKHLEIANFTEKHGVNVEWLLEGKGRIFKKDPIRLSPNSTGAEFAAVVATMPMADQQAIRAMVREIVQERDQ